MNYNYHAHTYRCHHASETPEEYIKRAIENGIKYMGFSEHIPLVFPDGHESDYRIKNDECADYVEEISALKEKYKDQIEIFIGFEMEYYPKYFDIMYNTAKKYNAQYLILGQHFIHSGDDVHEGIYVCIANDKKEDLAEYTANVLEAMDTDIFTYLAHPDVFNYTGDDDSFYAECAEKICTKSKELNMPLEINCWGIKNNRFYPNNKFWEIAGVIKSPVVFGFDSHNIHSAYDDISLEVAKEIVKKHNLNYIGKPALKSLKKF